MTHFPNNLKTIKKKSISPLSISPNIFTYAGKKSLTNATKMHPDARIKTFPMYSP